MAEYSAFALQTVNPGESIIFDTTAVPCLRGFVRHRDDTGSFLLSGFVPYNSCGCRSNSANYLVDFGANIAIPTDGTVEEISVAIAIDGATIPASTMRVTPTAVDEFWGISRAINARIWKGCCETISVRNVSEQPILVQEANIIFSRPDLYVMK